MKETESSLNFTGNCDSNETGGNSLMNYLYKMEMLRESEIKHETMGLSSEAVIINAAHNIWLGLIAEATKSNDFESMRLFVIFAINNFVLQWRIQRRK